MKGADLDIRSAWRHGRAGRYVLMRRHFRRFLDRDPGAGPFSRFLALMALRDYGGAFEMAERAMAGLSAVEREQFHRPWPDEWVRSPRLAARTRSFYLSELRALGLWSKSHPRSPWPGFFIGCVHWRLGSLRAALRSMAPLERRVEGRYAWLRYFPGLLRLTLGEYAAAGRDLSAASRAIPDFWHARCHLAETFLCSGSSGPAFKLFDRAAEDDDSGCVLAWRGEALLWLGDYVQAKAWLDRAVRAGANTAYCWRGASLMLLGDFPGALKDLDHAVSGAPEDAEALLWRGEVKRRMGRWEGALEDLGRSIRLSSADSWARCNRALVWRALGRPAAMRADFALLPRRTRAAILKAMARRAPATDLEVEEALASGLAMAGGVRRGEEYLQDIWMRRLRPKAAGS
ncbi:MAG: hypothetical protein HY924_02055 [Elusimicrobia bacterium]|nr:hypothetical protein [Elusimicrobiota bacterium]